MPSTLWGHIQTLRPVGEEEQRERYQDAGGARPSPRPRAELRGAVQGKDSPVTPVLASAIMASEETEEEHE
jgi:hypothetical protein